MKVVGVRSEKTGIWTIVMYVETKPYHDIPYPQQNSLLKVNIERVNCRSHLRGSTTQAELIFKTIALDENKN